VNGPAQAALGALPHGGAWLVGGVVRDRLLGRATADIDVAVEGDVRSAARAAARAAGGAAAFALSEDFGSWRVVARDGSWQLDVEPLRGGAIETDLAQRDFTVNAIAQAVSGGELIDPFGGVRDVRHRLLRAVGAGAFAADPLRVLRLVRIAVELGFEIEPETERLARSHAAELASVSAERVFTELRRILAAESVRRGLELMAGIGATAAVLPELEATRGVDQSRFHHLDVHDHTLAVIDAAVELTTPGREWPEELQPALAPFASEVRALLAEPLADGLTRGEALRWGALLHDIAKPDTRAIQPAGGRVTFIGHDVRGAARAREILTRLRTSERLRAHVAALVRHHLDLGFLVGEPQPLAARTVYAYLHACDPVEVDVTLLSLVDRVATRGDASGDAIAAHVAVARQMLEAALRWRADGPPRPLVRGDEVAAALGMTPGPALGALLEELASAQYAGEIATPEQAVEYARTLVARH
jgi:poly(A) polymerase